MRVKPKDILIAGTISSIIVTYLVSMWLKIEMTTQLWMLAFFSSIGSSLIENYILKNHITKRGKS